MSREKQLGSVLKKDFYAEYKRHPDAREKGDVHETITIAVGPIARKLNAERDARLAAEREQAGKEFDAHILDAAERKMSAMAEGRKARIAEIEAELERLKAEDAGE